MKSILVVDDDQDICDIVEGHLWGIGTGLNFIKAYSGEEAMDFLKQQNFDLVITDIIMTGIDGLELISHINEHYPETSILACSGGHHTSNTISSMALEKAESLGEVNTITKPFHKNELVKQVKSLLNL